MLRELVEVEWIDDYHDWPYFYLLEFKDGWVKLQGADYPDGSVKHGGNVIYVPSTEIRLMAVIDVGKVDG